MRDWLLFIFGMATLLMSALLFNHYTTELGKHYEVCVQMTHNPFECARVLHP